MTYFDRKQIEQILADAPSEETARLSYFIEQDRTILRGLYPEKQPAFASTCMGCQSNNLISESLDGTLKAIGYVQTEVEQEADFVIFNTCTIRENANEHLYGRLGALKQPKLKNPDMIIAICGCMMQETDEVEKMKNRFGYVDLIFGTHNTYTFPELIFMVFAKRHGVVLPIDSHNNEVLLNSDADIAKAEKLGRYDTEKNRQDLKKLYKKPVVSVWKDSSDIVEELPVDRKFPFKCGVQISYGCDNFCSYCVVPYVRGREKSREPEDILRDIERAGKDGVKEVMLLGQNVNSYGKGLSRKVNFSALLRMVDEHAEEYGIERIRFMTSHPKDLSDELIETMAQGKHICHQFHLPLQSGSSRILKRMNRHYDKEQYLDRAMKLRAAIPDIAISTDIIVGFPGETEEDFEETLDVVRRVQYDSAFTFIYSKREGTPAASYEDQVPEEVVKPRFERLLKLQTEISEQRCKRLVGQRVKAMVEEIDTHDASMVTGRLDGSACVHFPGDASLIGKIVDVVLDEAHGFYYIGHMV